MGHRKEILSNLFTVAKQRHSFFRNLPPLFAVEMSLAWNLTERECLTLYYDSAEELGRLACFQCFFVCLFVCLFVCFRFERASVQNRVCGLYSLEIEKKTKKRQLA